MKDTEHDLVIAFLEALAQANATVPQALTAFEFAMVIVLQRACAENNFTRQGALDAHIKHLNEMWDVTSVDPPAETKPEWTVEFSDQAAQKVAEDPEAAEVVREASSRIRQVIAEFEAGRFATMEGRAALHRRGAG